MDAPKLHGSERSCSGCCVKELVFARDGSLQGLTEATFS